MNKPIYWLEEIGWCANSYICGNILVDASQPVTTVTPYKDQINVIVLTHGHFDHMANLAALADLCHAKIYIGKEDLSFLTDDSLSLAPRFGKHSPGLTAEPLTDGDRIGEFIVLHTPGHTRGSICLYREEDGALISGDTLFSHGLFGRTDLPTGSYIDLISSLNRINALHIKSLWCGHGTPVLSHVVQEKGNTPHVE